MASLIEAIDIKRKMFFEYEGAPFHCIDVEVSKPTARGGQTLVRLKMRNLLTRAVFDKTFKAGEKFKEPDLVVESASYLYADSSGFNFMNQETFETLTLSSDVVGADAGCSPITSMSKSRSSTGGHWPPASSTRGARRDLYRAWRPRRYRQWRRDQAGDARDRPRDPCAAVHQGRGEGEGPHRDAGIRRARVEPIS